MHPLVQSPTQTSFKFSWSSFKTWIPDLTKRRDSQCSTATTSTSHTIYSYDQPYHQEELFIPPHTKRPSLTGLEGLGTVIGKKVKSQFRSKPPSVPTEADIEDRHNQIKQEIEQQKDLLEELCKRASMELKYAEDSQGSHYYAGDRIAAKEAIDFCEEAYTDLLSLLTEQDMIHPTSTPQFDISTLKQKYASLPPQDDY